MLAKRDLSVYVSNYGLMCKIWVKDIFIRCFGFCKDQQPQVLLRLS